MSKKTKNAPKTETQKIAERREEVLSKGRKFRYPIQYTKHRVVFNTIIIGVLVIAALAGLGWLALYKFQDTGDIIYRVTQVLPVTVASVDGEPVRYSDYLMIYRSNVQPVEKQNGQLGNDEDSQLLRQQYKRSALDNAESYAYAAKLGREKNITVSEDEIDTAYDNLRKVGGTEHSEENFAMILEKNYGLSVKEYRHILQSALLKSKVSQAIDPQAQTTATQIEAEIAGGNSDLAKIAEKFGDKVQYEETGTLVSSTNIDGGRATKALGLEPNQVSQKFLSTNGDGYYFVKLIAKKDTQVNYASIKVKFTTFNDQFNKLRQEQKIDEAIEL